MTDRNNSNEPQIIPRNSWDKELTDQSNASGSTQNLNPYSNSTNQTNSQLNGGLTPRNFNQPNLNHQNFNDQAINDPQVQPAGFSNSGTTTNMNVAEQLLDRMDVEQFVDNRFGVPVDLVDMISSVPTHERKQSIEAYWHTYTCYVKMRFASEELYFLKQLRSPAGAADKHLLNLALLLGQNRVSQTQLDFEEAKGNLGQYVTQMTGSSFVPADTPLLGKYQTHYDRFSSQRVMSHRLKVLHTILPKQHVLIHENATAAQTGRHALSQTVSAYNQGQATLAATLEAWRLCSQVNMAFADSVHQYNQSTTEYAEGVADFDHDANRVASMLIKTPKAFLTPALNTRQALNDSFYSQGGNSSTTNNPYSRGIPAANEVPVISSQPDNQSWQNPTGGTFQPTQPRFQSGAGPIYR